MMNLFGILAALAVTLLLWIVVPVVVAPLVLAAAALGGAITGRRGTHDAAPLADVHLIPAEHPRPQMVRAA